MRISSSEEKISLTGRKSEDLFGKKILDDGDVNFFVMELICFRWRESSYLLGFGVVGLKW